MSRGSPAPLSFTDPLTRAVWLSERPRCHCCGFEERRAHVSPGTLIQKMECPHEETRLSGRRHRCGAIWWCYALHPGTIGGTFAALFDFHAGRIFLHRLFPETHPLSDDDLWGFEVVKADGYRQLLQIEVSKCEAGERWPDPPALRRVLRAMAAAL